MIAVPASFKHAASIFDICGVFESLFVPVLVSKNGVVRKVEWNEFFFKSEDDLLFLTAQLDVHVMELL